MKFIDLSAQRDALGALLTDRIDSVLSGTRFIMGQEVREVEEVLAAFVGVANCISVANGTDALQIAMMAIGIKPGDEVIMPSFTYVATCETVALLGATPVFCDIDPNTYCADPVSVASKITDRTKAVIAVSLYGQCADMTALNELCSENDLVLIEDAAQSFGATQNGKKSCSLSKIACTSFFPTKPLGCYGDGGALFTDDDDLANVITQVARHGQSKRYHHVRVGVNSRLDTIQAAILLAKMELFPREVELRSQIGRLYCDLLKAKGLTPPKIAPGNSCVYAQYTVEVDNRSQVMSHMKEKFDIPTMVHYPLPLHKQPAYLNDVHLPNSTNAAERVVSLPMHPYITENEQNQVVDALADAMSLFAT